LRPFRGGGEANTLYATWSSGRKCSAVRTLGGVAVDHRQVSQRNLDDPNIEFASQDRCLSLCRACERNAQNITRGVKNKTPYIRIGSSANSSMKAMARFPSFLMYGRIANPYDGILMCEFAWCRMGPSESVLDAAGD